MASRTLIRSSSDCIIGLAVIDCVIGIPGAILMSMRMSRHLTRLVNALRHTPQDGQITLQAREENGSVQLAIRDSGTGIAPTPCAID